MNKEEIDNFPTKKGVKLVLNNQFCYTGNIEYIGVNSLRFCDKFGRIHIFDFHTIVELSEILGAKQ